MSNHTYSRGWWAARLNVIKAYASGKDILINGALPEDQRVMAFGLEPSSYSIAPDHVEHWVVLDGEGKIVAVQQSFGSADTIRAMKNRENTDQEGFCSNRHRVVHMKEVR